MAKPRKLTANLNLKRKHHNHFEEVMHLRWVIHETSNSFFPQKAFCAFTKAFILSVSSDTLTEARLVRWWKIYIYIYSLPPEKDVTDLSKFGYIYACMIQFSPKRKLLIYLETGEVRSTTSPNQASTEQRIPICWGNH
jgi:hypothetical protein